MDTKDLLTCFSVNSNYIIISGVGETILYKYEEKDNILIILLIISSILIILL